MRILRKAAYAAASRLHPIVGDAIYRITGLTSIHARIAEQRQRNRVMEAVDNLADGRDALIAFGAEGYFRPFLDLARSAAIPANRAFSDEERSALSALAATVQEGYDCSTGLSDDDILQSGWPDAIAREAEELLTLFRMRGFFCENVDEQEPSARAYL